MGSSSSSFKEKAESYVQKAESYVEKAKSPTASVGERGEAVEKLF